MNRPRHQLLARPAFTGNQNAAGLRGHARDEIKNGAHVSASPDDVVVSREAAQFTAQVTGFVLELEAFVHLADGATQLVHQLVVFDDIAIGARIDGGNGGLYGWHTRDQKKDGRRSYFLGIGE